MQEQESIMCCSVSEEIQPVNCFGGKSADPCYRLKQLTGRIFDRETNVSLNNKREITHANKVYSVSI